MNKVLLLESVILKNNGVYRISNISYDEAISLITNNGYVSAIMNNYVKKISSRLLMIENKWNTPYKHLETGEKAIVIDVDKEFIRGEEGMTIDDLKDITRFNLIERVE